MTINRLLSVLGTQTAAPGSASALTIVQYVASWPTFTVANCVNDGSGNLLTALANGALVVDSLNPAADDLILYGGQESGPPLLLAGVWSVVNPGSAGTLWQLARVLPDPTGLVYVQLGTLSGGTYWAHSRYGFREFGFAS